MQATLTKTKSAEPMGAYQRTAIDDRKDAADFLVTACYGEGYVIDARRITVPAGRGVKHISGNTYRLTERVLRALQATHTWATDF